VIHDDSCHGIQHDDHVSYHLEFPKHSKAKQHGLGASRWSAQEQTNYDTMPIWLLNSSTMQCMTHAVEQRHGLPAVLYAFAHMQTHYKAACKVASTYIPHKFRQGDAALCTATHCGTCLTSMLDSIVLTWPPCAGRANHKTAPGRQPPQYAQLTVPSETRIE
jgi:hypothetical protein